jgi:predicted O-methyltransferase YrrM
VKLHSVRKLSISNVKKKISLLKICLSEPDEQSNQSSGWGDFPNGHFYSTIPTLTEIDFGLEKSQESLETLIRDLNLLDSEMQLVARSIFEIGKNYSRDVYGGFTISDPRNALAFSPRDSLVLYSIIELYKPNKIIEIGAGESTTIMLDSINANALETKVTSIEPYPEYFESKVKISNFKNLKLLKDKVQNVNMKIFKDLLPGDMLFIDSSHVMKIGSDVQFLFENILPILPKGVLVHVHDIIWPFEYHERWLKSKIYWNEAYFLRGLLSNSNRYKIVWFGSYFEKYLLDKDFQDIPELFKLGDSGSIYFRVV